MALTQYKKKRSFDSTPEPQGGKGSHSQLRFVVQKHQASRLHYDFRLELDGVLLSWAVPKGPSLNPEDKRLAMQVEDHPMDYRLFEGTIPKGNYGAGTVMVWDEGTYTDYEESTDPTEIRKHIKAGFKKGDLKFRLQGKKLRGAYVLVKIQGQSQDENPWLLIKKKDKYATDEDVTQQDDSVLSSRSMEQISQGEAKWLTKAAINIDGAPKAKQPDSIKPMLATLIDQAFDHPDWLYEIKWDGYRIMAHIKSGIVQLKSRGDKDYTPVFLPVATELANLNVDCILDGEVVVLDAAGRSEFGALQNYQRTGEGYLAYMVFDVPYAEGRDLRSLQLIRRKEIVAQIVEPLERVRYSDHVLERGNNFFTLAEKQQLEGIMAKDGASSYQSGKRSKAWLKIKTHLRQEVVIGGFTEPRGSRKKIGALVLGVYDEAGKLHYIGHTGGGLNDRLLHELYDRFNPRARKTSPFASTFKTNAPVTWVQPQFTAEVDFAEWTPDGHMRHPVFVGLRNDKDPREVRRENSKRKPIETEAAKSKPKTKKGSRVKRKGKAELTNLDKLYWPQDGYTKGDLIYYYDSIASTILPYLFGRPESLNRHPNGIDGNNFFQKDLENHPDWIQTKSIYSESNEKHIQWLLCNNQETLRYMANLGCIELNPWHSGVESLDKPDYCLIDLDAKTSDFESIITTAKETHKVLEELSVPSYPKTSGKTGIHVCIPLGAAYSYEQSKLFANIIVNLVNRRLPKLTSVERNPSKRTHKIYLDYLQNRRGQTMAAPYCVRPVPGATVSTPLDWSEVRKGLNPQKFTITTMGKRLQSTGDLWKPVIGKGIDLQKVLSTLQ